jgi:hypothetical protein
MGGRFERAKNHPAGSRNSTARGSRNVKHGRPKGIRNHSNRRHIAPPVHSNSAVNPGPWSLSGGAPSRRGVARTCSRGGSHGSAWTGWGRGKLSAPRPATARHEMTRPIRAGHRRPGRYEAAWRPSERARIEGHVSSCWNQATWKNVPDSGKTLSSGSRAVAFSGAECTNGSLRLTFTRRRCRSFSLSSNLGAELRALPSRRRDSFSVAGRWSVCDR